MRGILIFHLNFKVFSISRPFPSLTFLNPIHGFWILFQFLFAIFYHSKRDLSRVSPFHFKHFFTFGLESNNIWSRWLWNQFYIFLPKSLAFSLILVLPGGRFSLLQFRPPHPKSTFHRLSSISVFSIIFLSKIWVAGAY